MDPQQRLWIVLDSKTSFHQQQPLGNSNTGEKITIPDKNGSSDILEQTRKNEIVFEPYMSQSLSNSFPNLLIRKTLPSDEALHISRRPTFNKITINLNDTEDEDSSEKGHLKNYALQQVKKLALSQQSLISPSLDFSSNDSSKDSDSDLIDNGLLIPKVSEGLRRRNTLTRAVSYKSDKTKSEPQTELTRRKELPKYYRSATRPALLDNIQTKETFPSALKNGKFKAIEPSLTINTLKSMSRLSLHDKSSNPNSEVQLFPPGEIYASNAQLTINMTRIAANANVLIPQKPQEYIDPAILKAEEQMKAWERLKSEMLDRTGHVEVEFSTIQNVVEIARGLQKLGFDMSLVNRCRLSTLRIVLAIKRWQARAKQRKRPRLKIIIAQNHRLSTNLPTALHQEIMNEALPVLNKMASMYKIYLGSQDPKTVGIQLHIKKFGVAESKRPNIIEKIRRYSMLDTNTSLGRRKSRMYTQESFRGREMNLKSSSMLRKKTSKVYPSEVVNKPLENHLLSVNRRKSVKIHPTGRIDSQNFVLKSNRNSEMSNSKSSSPKSVSTSNSQKDGAVFLKIPEITVVTDFSSKEEDEKQIVIDIE